MHTTSRHYHQNSNTIWIQPMTASGLLIYREDRNGNRTEYEYDAFDQIVHATLADDTVRAMAPQLGVKTTTSGELDISLDDETLSEFVDGRGNPSSKIADDHGRVLQNIDEIGRMTLIDRDADSNPVSLRNHLGHTTTLEYNSRGQVSRMLSPNNLETLFSYNDEGLLQSKTEHPPAGSPVDIRTYHYDKNSNITQIDHASSPVHHYGYDPLDRLISDQTAP